MHFISNSIISTFSIHSFALASDIVGDGDGGGDDDDIVGDGDGGGDDDAEVVVVP